MGAGASMGNDQVLGGAHGSGDARRYFCHQCHQITRSRSLAAECGADAVKFQTHISEAETLKNAPLDAAIAVDTAGKQLFNVKII